VKRSIQTIPVPQNVNPELKRYLEELNRQIYEVAKRQIIPFDLDTGGNSIYNLKSAMGVVNVKGFGAKGDGVTDDHDAIESAINAVAAAGGGIVYFPKGNYLTSSQITLKSGMSLLGSGKSSKIFTISNGVKILYGYNITNVTIENLWIENNQSDDASCIYIDGGSTEHIKILNNWLSKPGLNGGGVRINDGNDILIEGNIVWGGVGSNVSSAIMTYLHPTNVIIRGNICDGNSNQQSQGIFVPCPYDAIIEGNICRNFARHGIETYNNEVYGRCVINGNICYNNFWTGIYAQGTSSQTIVSNNICYNNGGASGVGPNTGNIVAVGGSDVNKKTILIIGNSLYDTREADAPCTGSIAIQKDGISVIGNLILQENSSSPGIGASVGGRHWTVSNNRICNQNGKGIYLLGGDKSNLLISGNNIISDSYGIYVEDTIDHIAQYISIIGNTIKSLNSRCISLRGIRGGGQNVISNNSCLSQGVADSVIYLDDSYNILVKNNSIDGGGVAPGIRTYHECTGSEFQENRFQNCVSRYSLYGGETNKVIGRVITWGTAAPTSGTWERGDICWNTSPSAGGSPGWVCVESGTPGVWKAMANLAT